MIPSGTVEISPREGYFPLAWDFHLIGAKKGDIVFYERAEWSEVKPLQVYVIYDNKLKGFKYGILFYEKPFISFFGGMYRNQRYYPGEIELFGVIKDVAPAGSPKLKAASIKRLKAQSKTV